MFYNYWYILNASNIQVAEPMKKWWDYILFVILWNHYCSRELMFMDFVRYLYPKVYIPTKLLQIYCLKTTHEVMSP